MQAEFKKWLSVVLVCTIVISTIAVNDYYKSSLYADEVSAGGVEGEDVSGGDVSGGDSEDEEYLPKFEVSDEEGTGAGTNEAYAQDTTLYFKASGFTSVSATVDGVEAQLTQLEKDGYTVLSYDTSSLENFKKHMLHVELGYSKPEAVSLMSMDSENTKSFDVEIRKFVGAPEDMTVDLVGWTTESGGTRYYKTEKSLIPKIGSSGLDVSYLQSEINSVESKLKSDGDGTYTYHTVFLNGESRDYEVIGTYAQGEASETVRISLEGSTAKKEYVDYYAGGNNRDKGYFVLSSGVDTYVVEGVEDFDTVEVSGVPDSAVTKKSEENKIELNFEELGDLTTYTFKITAGEVSLSTLFIICKDLSDFEALESEVRDIRLSNGSGGDGIFRDDITDGVVYYKGSLVVSPTSALNGNDKYANFDRNWFIKTITFHIDKADGEEEDKVYIFDRRIMGVNIRVQDGDSIKVVVKHALDSVEDDVIDLGKFVLDDTVDGAMLDEEESTVVFQDTLLGERYITNNAGYIIIKGVDSKSGVESLRIRDYGRVDSSYVTVQGDKIRIDTSRLSDNTYNVEVWVTDKMGNTVSCPVEFKVMQNGDDYEVPIKDVVGGIEGLDGKYYMGSEGLSFSIGAFSRYIESVELYKDGVRVEDLSEKVSHTLYEEGTYSLKVTTAFGVHDVEMDFDGHGDTVYKDEELDSLSYSGLEGGKENQVGNYKYVVEDGNLVWLAADEKSGIDDGSSLVTVEVDGVSGTVSGVYGDGEIKVDTRQLSDGEHTVKVTVKDRVGNSKVDSQTVLLAREVPEVHGATHSEVYVNEGTAYTKDEISLSIEDIPEGSKVYLVKDGVRTEFAEGSAVISKDGTYTIEVENKAGKVQSYDLPDLFGSGVAGNVVFDTEVDSLEFTTESVGYSEATAQEDEKWIIRDGVIAYQASDSKSGIKSIDVTCDDLPLAWSGSQGTINVNTSSIASDGVHTIKVVVTDNVGNTKEAERVVRLLRNRQGIIGASAVGGYTPEDKSATYVGNDGLVLTVSGYDNGLIYSVELMCDGYGYKDFWSYEGGSQLGYVSVDKAGTYTVRVVDMAGETKDYNLADLFPGLSNVVVIDTEIDDMSLREESVVTTRGTDGTDYLTNDVDIVFNLVESKSGIKSVKVSSTGNPSISGSIEGNSYKVPTVGLPEGESTVTVEVEDNVGNKAMATATVNKFTVMPEVTGGSHGSVTNVGYTSYSAGDVLLKVSSVINMKISKLELMKGTEKVSDFIEGDATITESGNYSVKLTDVVGREKTYQLFDLYTGDIVMYSDVVVDRVAPVISFGSSTLEVQQGTDGRQYVISDRGELVWNVAENDSSVSKVTVEYGDRVALDNAYDAQAGTIIVQARSLPEGTVTIKVSAVDLVGNVSNVETITLNVMRSTPVLMGESHSEVVTIDGVSYSKGVVDLEVSGYDDVRISRVELVKDKAEAVGFVNGGASISEDGSYVVKLTTKANTVVEYQLGALFSGMSGAVVIDTEAVSVVMSSETADEEYGFDGRDYVVVDGLMEYDLQDAKSGIKSVVVTCNGSDLSNQYSVVNQNGSRVLESKVTINTTDLPEGNCKIAIVVTDNVGNEYTENKEVNVLRVIPSVRGRSAGTVQNYGGISYSQGSLAVELEEVDKVHIQKVELLKNGSVVKDVTSGSFTIDEDGLYSLSLTDVLGRVGTYTLSGLFQGLCDSIVVDNEKPVITANLNGGLISEGWVTGDGMLGYAVNDDKDLLSVDVMVNTVGVNTMLDSARLSSHSGTVDLKTEVPTPADGVYNVRFSATDKSGRVADVYLVVIKYDYSYPTVAFGVSGDYVVSGGKIYVDGALVLTDAGSSDIGAGVASYEVLKGQDVYGTGKEVSIGEDGSYSVRVTDGAGLSTVVSLGDIMGTDTSEVVIDVSTPVIRRGTGFNFDLVQDGQGWYRKSPELVYTVEDNYLKSVTVSINGDQKYVGVEAEGSYRVSTQGYSGDVEVVVVAVDEFGHRAEDRFSYKTDFNAPVIGSAEISSEYLERLGTLFFKEAPVLTVRASDSETGMGRYLLSGSKVEENTSGNFLLGTGEFGIEVIDNIGNTTGVVPVSSVCGLSSNTFVVDGDAPMVGISRPEGVNGWFPGDVGYTAVANDAIGVARIVATVNGVEVGKAETDALGVSELVLSFSTNGVAVDEGGMYTVVVEAFDNAGNSVSSTDYVYVDTVLPSIEEFTFTGDGHQDGNRINGGGQYGFYFTGNASCSVRVSDGTVTSGVRSVFVEFSPEGGSSYVEEYAVSGGYASFSLPDNFKGFIRAYAEDAVGNKGSWNAPDGIVSGNAGINSLSVDIQLPATNYVDTEGYPLYNSDINATAEVGASYAGIRSVKWGLNDIELGSQEVGNGSGNANGRLTVSLTEGLMLQGNQNGLVVWASVEDRAGRTSRSEKVFSIDRDLPQMSVSWNVSEEDSFYNVPRVATISVTERNFNPNLVEVRGQGSLSAWSRAGDTWVSTVTFRDEGRYSLGVEVQDMAGNRGTGYSSEEFVVDTVKPVISVVWSSGTAKNGRYYNTGRSATITVEEVNFNPALFSVVTGGKVSGWTNGDRVHTLRVDFPEDGVYNLSVAGHDTAGNEAEPYTSEEFIIDTSEPKVSISGVINGVSYKGDVNFEVAVEDSYVDVLNSYIRLTGKSRGSIEVPVELTGKGGSVAYDDFSRDKVVDDVYTLEVHIEDMAGNCFDEVRIFSVNRFGSSYGFSNEDILNQYVHDVDDLSVFEDNVDELNTKNTKVVLIRNGQEVEVPIEFLDIEEVESVDGKHHYKYTLKKGLFSEDGRYIIRVFSESEDGTAYDSESMEYSFVLDTAAPQILVSGVENGGSYYEYSRAVSVVIREANGLEAVLVKLNGEPVVLEEDGDTYSFVIPEAEGTQSFSVTAVDLSGNTTYVEVNGITVTSSTFVYVVNQWWFKLAVSLVIMFILFLIVILLKNRHDKKKAEEALIRENAELYRTSGSASSSSLGSGSGKDVAEDLDK